MAKDDPDPVSWAVMANNLTDLRAALESGGDPNALYANTSALMKASYSDEMESAAELLIERGANVNFKSEDGNSPLHVAAYSAPHVLRHLVKNGALVNVVDQDGMTPLMSASKAGNLDSVKLLIAGGADVHAKDVNGMNAIHWAVTENDNLEVIQLLLDHGVDASTKNKAGLTPVQSAKALGLETTYALLLSHSSNL